MKVLELAFCMMLVLLECIFHFMLCFEEYGSFCHRTDVWPVFSGFTCSFWELSCCPLTATCCLFEAPGSDQDLGKCAHSIFEELFSLFLFSSTRVLCLRPLCFVSLCLWCFVHCFYSVPPGLRRLMWWNFTNAVTVDTFRLSAGINSQS